MTCKEIETLLPALLEGALSVLEKKTVEDHLRACESCSKTLRDLRKSDELVKCLEEVEPPPWLKTRVMARVREEAGQKEGLFRKLFFPLHIKIPIQALAMVLIAVVAWNVYRTGEPEFGRIAPPEAVQQTKRSQAPSESVKEAAPAPIPPAAKKEAGERSEVREKKALAPSPSIAQDRAKRQEPTVREEAKADSAKPAAESMKAARPAAAPVRDADVLKGAGAVRQPEMNESARSLAQESKQALQAPVGAVAKEARKQEAASAAAPVFSPAAPAQAAPDMILRVRNPEAAADEVGNELKRLGGRIVDRQTFADRVTLNARIGGDRLQALREKIRSLGEVREDNPAAPYPDARGNIAIRIEIRQN